jgi:integrase
MASIRKVGDYQFEASIARMGWPRISKTFIYKKDAEDWARENEAAMKRGDWQNPQLATLTTLKDCLNKYASEISSRKKGEARELARLKTWMAHPLAKMNMQHIRSEQIAAHRDARRKIVTDATIRLELTLLSGVFEYARKEWGMTSITNPVRGIKMPQGSKRRTRRLTSKELDSFFSELDKTCRNPDIPRVTRFALATAMRQSEIIGKKETSTLESTLGLTWENINFKKSTAFLPDTKSPTGKEKSRTIPLNSAALKIISELPRPIDGGRVFKVTQDGLCRAVAAACKVAGIDDFSFHDLRHESTSRFVEMGLGMQEVMSITGHSSREMLDSYTHLNAEDLVAKIG